MARKEEAHGGEPACYADSERIRLLSIQLACAREGVDDDVIANDAFNIHGLV